MLFVRGSVCCCNVKPVLFHAEYISVSGVHESVTDIYFCRVFIA